MLYIISKDTSLTANSFELRTKVFKCFNRTLSLEFISIAMPMPIAFDDNCESVTEINAVFATVFLIGSNIVKSALDSAGMEYTKARKKLFSLFKKFIRNIDLDIPSKV